MEFIMNATIRQLIGGGIGIVAFLSFFFEFSKIKFNPISAILNWIGERTNKGIFSRIDGLEKDINNLYTKVDELEERAEERQAINCRVRILRFADELRRNIDHSQESYGQTLSDIDTYEKYCKEHPQFENNKTVIASKRIKESYDTRLVKNDFL